MFETEIFEAFGMDIESGDHGLQPTPRPSSYIPVKSVLFRYAEYGKVCVFYNNSINYFIFVILRNIRDTEAVAHRCFVKKVFLEILQNS